MDKKIKVFVDLDNTLIDTNVAKEGLFAVVESMGVGPDEVRKRYSSVSTKQFTLEGFASAFSDVVDEDALLAKLKAYNENLPFPLIEGRFAWLDANYPPEQYERILYTFGNPDFQGQKVKGLGLAEHFSDVVYVEGNKAEALREYVKEGENFIFIDDKVDVLEGVRERFPNAQILHAQEGGGDPSIYIPAEDSENQPEGNLKIN